MNPPENFPASKSDKPHSCGGCKARWSGSLTCHCAANNCHRTFGGVTAFDAHRISGHCEDPTRLKKPMTFVRPGVWGWTETGEPSSPKAPPKKRQP